MYLNNKIYGHISREELIADLKRVAIEVGGQSVTRSQYSRFGKFTESQFYRNFGSWKSALREVGLVPWGERPQSAKCYRISEKTRLAVFRRDNFKCIQCGASPATNSAVILCADHMLAFSKGGRTEMENLQTLCFQCNLKKGAR